MSIYKSSKLGFIILAAACGLSSCLMYDDQERSDNSPQQTSTIYEQTTNQPAKAKVSATKNKAISSEPVQKSTPGPKRAAAPQLPVIQ